MKKTDCTLRRLCGVRVVFTANTADYLAMSSKIGTRPGEKDPKEHPNSDGIDENKRPRPIADEKIWHLSGQRVARMG
jgi:hypothetical protein